MWSMDNKIEKLQTEITFNSEEFGKALKKQRKKMAAEYKKHAHERNNPYEVYQICESQEGIADLLNVDRATVSNWETGKSIPSLDQAYMLSFALNCRLDSLLGYKEVDDKTNELLLEDHTGSSLVQKLTGIDKDIIDLLLKDQEYLRILNAFMHPKNSSFLLGLVNNVDILKTFSQTELIGISDPLKTLIINSFNNCRVICGPSGCNIDSFKKSLSADLDPHKINLSKRKKQETIYVKSCIAKEISDEIDFSCYDKFIETLAKYCYEKLNNMEQYKLYKNQLLEQFDRFIDAFIVGEYYGSTIQILLPTH